MSQKQKHQQKRIPLSHEKFNWLFLPLILLVGLIPLCVRLTLIQVSDATFRIFGAEYQTDLFSHYKAIFLLVIGVAVIFAAVISFRKMFDRRDRYTAIYLIAGGIYLLFTLLSAILSDYKQEAFWGYYNRSEGFITICCYLLVFAYTIYAYRSAGDYRYVVAALGVVVVINAALGAGQYIGYDFYASDFGLKLIIPSQYSDMVQNVNLLYETGKLHGSFFHYNYVGSFSGIVIPLFVVLALYAEKLRERIILGVLALFSFWLLFGSTSRAGIIGVVAAAVFGAVILGREIIRKWRPLAVAAVAIIVVAVGLNFATRGAIFERIPGLVNDIFSVFSDTSDFDYKTKLPVWDVTNQEDGTVTLALQKGDSLTLRCNGELDFTVSNAAGEEIAFSADAEGLFRTTDKRYQRFSFFSFGGNSNSSYYDSLMFQVDNQPIFRFRISTEHRLHLTDANGLADIEAVDPPSIGFKGKEKLGSMRGYIWSRTIPLLRDNLLVGSGPDTFIFRFPQNDLIGKYWAYDTPFMVVDKPHNLYLQIFINEGGIALLAYLTIMITYMVDSLRLYALKQKYSKEEILGIAAFLGVIGYLFAGLFNDSVVDISAIFWVILGMGIAVNYQNRHRAAEIVESTSRRETAR